MLKMFKPLHVLPLYNNPVPPPCSWATWLLVGFLLALTSVLALEPSLIFNFFHFLFTCFGLALDFYRSETGELVVSYVNQLNFVYNSYKFTRKLEERNKRRINMIPPLFMWIL